MKVFVLYRENSDHGRSVVEFARDFEHQTDKTVELFDMDSREGYEKARLYDITSYPAVVAVKEDGQVLKVWNDPMLPRIQEVSFYAEEK
ncbi:MAG: hypothetical protein R3313_05060 [Candidatus Saccharimonadales bacterium]|nr:hypothetical protein [Candidatus Saccharimonadales bacterium]